MADRRTLAQPRPRVFFLRDHDRDIAGVEDQIVFVAMLPDGSQQTFTPADFAKTFGWKNDTEKAKLLGKKPHSPERGQCRGLRVPRCGERGCDGCQLTMKKTTVYLDTNIVSTLHHNGVGPK